jgi:hypothetical protein
MSVVFMLEEGVELRGSKIREMFASKDRLVSPQYLIFAAEGRSRRWLSPVIGQYLL